MTIAETRERCKGFFASVPRDALIIAVLVLASLLSFGLGYLAGQDAAAREVGRAPETPTVAASTTNQVVASKNGTKYYLPGCAGAERISDANKVWFVSAESARAAGYAPAVGCNGL